jgi:hypothetical protein
MIFFIIAIAPGCSGLIGLLGQEVARKRESRNFHRTHIASYERYEQALSNYCRAECPR